MAEIFYLPKMGQTMTEATILKWLKQEGDHVESWEAVVEMMTDKINMETEALITGTLLKIVEPEGAVVPLGGPLAVFGKPDEDISGLLAELAGGGLSAPTSTDGSETTDLLSGQVSSTPAAEATTTFSGGASTDELPSVSPRAREAAGEGGLEWRGLSLPGSGFEGMVVERDVLAFLEQRPAETPPVLATPLAAKIAADQGVTLGDLSGSGPRGRVTADDVRRAASGRRSAPRIEAREIKLQGMRKVIANRLSASYQQAVHVPLRVDVDMSAAGELRRQLKPALDAMGARLTYTDLIAAAVTQALIAQPLLNATLEGDVIRIHPSVNLGIAVALDEGLTVPVIRDAHALRLPELSTVIQDLATKARARTLPAEAFADGTFTISNLGNFGVNNFDPIINPPQVAILGVGSIEDRVVARNGAPAIRPMMTLTVCFDHRATDGAPAAQFLATLKELIENPARLLLL
jgi:pyruvate dehydrogenase E2 component (dihydrolipoamide acetyltransferase)